MVESGLAPSERRHPKTMGIDELPPGELVAVILREDAVVPLAVSKALPSLEALVVLAVRSLRDGGRVHYVGAGTSGRLGHLDAAEIPPTYGVRGAFVAHIAGGEPALTRSVEGAEDDPSAGSAAVAQVGERDLVLGLAASGGTPYVGGALRAARAQGAATALITSNPDPPLAPFADVVVVLDTGPEVITGSTRMKAGSALKMALNAFSTAVMVLLGHTYSNLMVDVESTNAKLDARRLRILQDATGADPAICAGALHDSSGELKTAIVAVLTGCAVDEARQALARTSGSVRAALAAMDEPR